MAADKKHRGGFNTLAGFGSHADTACGQLSQKDTVSYRRGRVWIFLQHANESSSNVCYDSNITCIHQLLSWTSPRLTPPSNTKLAFVISCPTLTHEMRKEDSLFLPVVQVYWRPPLCHLISTHNTPSCFSYSSKAWWPRGTARPFRSLICNYRCPEARWRVSTENISLINL